MMLFSDTSMLLFIFCYIDFTFDCYSGLHPRETVRRVFVCFRKVSGGCNGFTGFGFNGCLSVTSLFVLSQALGMCDKNLVDLGAGEGLVMASALTLSAKNVIGYELPENSAHRFVYEAVFQRVSAGSVHVVPLHSQVSS